MDLSHIKGFEWDGGNYLKSVEEHSLANTEAEEIFFNQPLLIYPDIVHSKHESRYYALRSTNKGRLLFNVFTIRNKKTRVISVRDMSKKEKLVYEKK